MSTRVITDDVFRRVQVHYAPTGGTMVEWELDLNFHDPAPYSFQLQVSTSSVPTADDWDDVGDPIEDTYWAVDSEQRIFGKTMEIHYRVVLTTSVEEYTSHSATGVFSASMFRDWRIRRSILRQEKKRIEKYTGVNGWLLKERRYGVQCEDCKMWGSDAPRTEDCETCYGVGIEGGYFEGFYMPMEFVKLDDKREEQDSSGKGTVKEDIVLARFPGCPNLNSRDLYVASDTGMRWSIEKITHTARVRGFNLVQVAELRLLPFSSHLYRVPTPEE